MSEWASYQMQDFVPFSADVYFRLLARMGESFWPLQLVTLAVGLLTLLLAFRGRVRIALALLAPLWGLVAVAFFVRRYTGLNWAGEIIGWAWLLQSALLFLVSFTGWGRAPRPALLSPALQSGLLVALLGLIGFPLLALASGHPPPQAEAFGLHPDPTAVATLGILLIAARGPALWSLALVPMLWLAISGLTLKVLGAPWYPVLFAVLAVVIAGLIASHYQPASR